LPDRLAPREPAVIGLRVFDENFQPAARELTALTVLWSQPGGALHEAYPRETGPGRYEIELTGLSPGRHKLKASARYRGKPLGEDEIAFDWAKASPEQPVDRAWLRQAAVSASGGFFDLEGQSPEPLLDKLTPVRVQSQVSRRSRPWASPWWLGAALALFFGEWFWRRWRGYH
jgi:hypothetical protein